MKIRILVLALLFSEASAQQKEGALDVGGYLKSLFSRSNTAVYGDLTGIPFTAV